jgi:isoleucyl-tRNA synthetase
MKLAALGRAARSGADVKLRQPLARAAVAVPTAAEAAAVERLAAHLVDELNVKALTVVRDEGDLVSYTLRPVLPKLGPRFGPQVPAIRALLQQQDAADVARRLAAGEGIHLAGPGVDVVLAPDEVEVLAAARPGLATAGADGYVVGVATEVTAELAAEGLARDVVRRVQQLRKDAGLDISDRIRLVVDAPDPIRAAVDAWREHVAGETLATELTLGPVGDGLASDTADIDGQAVTIGLQKVEGG